MTQTVAPGDTITLPPANVGSSSSVIVQVKNSGNATGTINSVSTSGPFALTNSLSLPVTVTNGNSFSVPITFTPTQVGTQTGQLVIGNDSFILSGQGLGSKANVCVHIQRWHHQRSIRPRVTQSFSVPSKWANQSKSPSPRLIRGCCRRRSQI